MVKVEIVDEKDNSPYASGSSAAASSSESLSSVDSDISNDDETIFDRLAALVDIVPPTTRHKITSNLASAGSFLKTTGKVVGNIVWIVTTSALLVGLPLAVSLEDEAKVVAQEKEALEQQAGQQMLSSGLYPSPASSAPKPLVPPGF
ncbi:mitochondrial import translocase, subunit Tom22 [Rhodocollybia butyracea]|uniref:Mitochondrial import translocase, subunit Tom22 n=1 Tax=Rhodocollybia butyracea TaxID=206335 RepID=A0A9P5Q8M9_9AGAR|nr:mitochondrial import translocase, subunit Tom22 [Rhodocollybia butyracea]